MRIHIENRTKYWFGEACLALSVLVSYYSFASGQDAAMSGVIPPLWLHILEFFIAIGLVVVKIMTHKYKDPNYQE